VPADGRPLGAYGHDRPDAGQGVVSEVRRQGNVGSAERNGLVGEQRSSVVSRHAGYAAQGPLDESNKHEVVPAERNPRIMDNATIHALRGSVKWLNRTTLVSVLITNSRRRLSTK